MKRSIILVFGFAAIPAVASAAVAFPDLPGSGPSLLSITSQASTPVRATINRPIRQSSYAYYPRYYSSYPYYYDSYGYLYDPYYPTTNPNAP